ncbi:hypothetical protein QWY86_04855 [Pedobacter aquatilis]|uniref:hypothetical protein n=1 Tax=Pedobacter aquatilis TaxID=351343 RepID=UPI0025B3FABB|nr:hypothetical protein [Pedobacter aquatilis]MDN3585984.1 hypothetical protein [Pedobacter aquatilis]
MNSLIRTALKVVICDISGTSVMTLFSWMTSKKKPGFQEPAHLGKMAHRLLPLISKDKSRLVGWAAHYGMGGLFTILYIYLWENRKLKCDLSTTLLLGLVSGVAGAGIWKATFKYHPLPGKTNYNLFYLQRIPAHIVFAIFGSLTYHIINKHENNMASQKVLPVEVDYQASESRRITLP